MSNKFWKGVMNVLLIQLAVIVLLVSIIDTARANDPKRPYNEQPKYAWVFCKLAGIPKNRCHGKKP